MISIVQGTCVDIQSVYQGNLLFLPTSDSSNELCNFAESIVQEVFECEINKLRTDNSTDLNLFISKARKCKNIFTNSTETKKLLRDLILDRYQSDPKSELLFDVPRLRIIPNSGFLSSGISYNYKPHRDTWYGAGQDQINHWLGLANVSENSTFYISPSFFGRAVANNSNIFDLDEWDLKCRPVADSNRLSEERPHPVPFQNLDTVEGLKIVMPRGQEVVFSGHHLHGSAPNSTPFVRFSIDYRVYPSRSNYSIPPNLDNKANGDYRKYMFPVSQSVDPDQG